MICQKISTCTFIDFVENNHPARLFRPARLMFSMNFSTCTFILPYTSIRHTRVSKYLKFVRTPNEPTISIFAGNYLWMGLITICLNFAPDHPQFQLWNRIRQILHLRKLRQLQIGFLEFRKWNKLALHIIHRRHRPLTLKNRNNITSLVSTSTLKPNSSNSSSSKASSASERILGI